MCGICGFTGKADDIVIRKMSGVLLHRGPDEDGFYSDGLVNLAIRRLSIIDVESGHQPIHNEDKTLWTVFNGEIYNYRELREDLEAKGHGFYTDHSDTEVIVHLFEEYGEGFVNRLNGMFAIALWDVRGKRLLLIRDRMGVKPLYYTVAGGNIIFGSEIKAILSHPSCSKEMEAEAIYHYLSLKNVPAPLTAFKGIYSLLPGEMLTFKAGVIEKRRYWKVSFMEESGRAEEEVEERILGLLEDAVRLRMRCDVEFGAYLSGGVDSSAVVALMSRHSSRPIKTFSLGYEDDLKNKEADLFHARRVARAFATDHHEYIMSSEELVRDIPDVLAAFDQPFSGTISTFFLSKLIKKHVKVALSGDGADELFGSYLSHRAAQPMYHYTRLHGKVMSGSLTDEEKDLFKPCDMEFLSGLFGKSGGEEHRWRHSLCLFTDAEKDALFSGSFKDALRGASSEALMKACFEATTSLDPLNRMLEMEWNTQLPDQVLAFMDFLSMAHSVEIRSPFLDFRLVEYAAAIPGAMKIKNGSVKDILKKAVEGVIPDGITKRPKEGFVLPVYDWMQDKLKGFCVDTLSRQRIQRHGLFNPDAVDGLVSGFYGGARPLAGKVWNLMMFQLWWEEYFAG